MPPRLVTGRAVDRSLLQSGDAARRATVAVTSLHQAAKRGTSEKFNKSELDELTSPDMLAAMTPRQLSLVAWSIGRLKLAPLVKSGNLPLLLSRKSANMDAQGLSMTLWSFASLAGQSGQNCLVTPIVHHAAAAISQMSAQGVSNTLWACALLRQEHGPLLVAAQAVPVVSAVAGSGTQVAANVIWATALLCGSETTGSPLHRAACSVATQRSRELRAEEQAAILWALALVPSSSYARQTLSVVSDRALRSLAPKPMAAAAWAFATLAELGPFWPRMSTATVAALSSQSFSSQELARTCWAFATAQCSSQAAPGLWMALSQAALHLPEFSPPELAAVSWSMAAARFVCLAWSAKFQGPEADACGGLGGMNLRALASMAWSWTTLAFSSGFLAEIIMPAAAEELATASEQLRSGQLEDWPRSEVRRELLDPLLQLAWAFSFARVNAEPLLAVASRLAVSIGQSWDACLPQSVKSGAAAADAASPDDRKPEVLLSAPGIVFLRKPPGWEVDGGKDAMTRPGSSPPKLSTFLRALCPHPVLRDLACGFGFLGRLDLPSEGIVLSATSYRAYYMLRLQQDRLN